MCDAAQATDADFHDLLGKCVTLHGLKARPDLNGVRGRVLSFDHRTGRAGVKVAGDGQMLSIKPANLDPDVKIDGAPENAAACDESKSLASGLTDLALNDDADTIGRLLAANANVDQRDPAGNTALICAAFAGTAACARLLLGAKASCDAATPRGFTPLMAASLLILGGAVWLWASNGSA